MCTCHSIILELYCDFLIALNSDNISGIRGKPTVLEGSNLSLICEGLSGVEPNITWTKEKLGSQGNTSVVQEGKVLTITNIDRSDAGTFTCTAYNGYGKLEKRIEYMNRVFIWGRRPDVSSGRLPFHVRYFEINIGDFFLLLYYIFFLLRHLMNILTRG